MQKLSGKRYVLSKFYRYRLLRNEGKTLHSPTVEKSRKRGEIASLRCVFLMLTIDL